MAQKYLFIAILSVKMSRVNKALICYNLAIRKLQSENSKLIKKISSQLRKQSNKLKRTFEKHF